MSKQFISDTVRNQISGKLKDAFFGEYGYDPSHAEVNAWQNSLRAMAQVVDHGGLHDHGVILEMQVPLTSLRIDCLLTGRDTTGAANAVIMELKQWQRCEVTEGQNEV